MEKSVFIAQILSVIYMSIGIGMLFNKTYYQELFEQLAKNKSLLFISGFLAVISGFLLIEFHNIWNADWRVLVTIVGWLALIKGIVLLAFPKTVKHYLPLFKSKNFNIILIPVIFLFGLIFTYFGFLY